MSLPKVSVIGIGGLGRALTNTLFDRDIPVKSIFNRSEGPLQLAEQLEIEIAGSFPQKAAQLGDLVFLTVSDRAIREVAGRLAGLADDFSGRTFVHCSGNESAALLQPLKAKGAATAAFHPLQTFTPQSGPDSFSGIYFSLQGDKKAFPILGQLATQIGAHYFEVSEKQKSHLHAAAVMASNYLNTLLDAAVETGTLSGLPESQVQKALLPLVKTTLGNIGETSSAEALTGPIKRGDIQTVRKHLDMLKDHHDLLGLYRMMGLQTVELSQKSGTLDETTTAELRNLFTVE